ncbi:hypothetical protein ACFFH2_11990 [Enterococcus devriesei]|uniref:Integral membrane protein n=1 Tax=Enterococcus devriesei TaxID=319970 RepID=A0A1L8SMQ9_9ENTE|nr:hypothetical protein [Enterococcus devriesei]MBU5366425.1 hypothetical protein [Enterococcus devriesei]MDT2820940.1 hypothetical protein [Enterococcus devriesei]OJG33258.1 hypothetical protein RV00_GL001492 [Enterococcus devriesei]
MNKERIKQFPFVFFLIPYIHISLAMDYLFDSIIGIFLFVLVTAIIGFFAKRTQQLPLLVIGNIINILLSGLLILQKSPLVNLYHSSSPFTAIAPLCVLFLISQITGIFWGSFFIKESSLTLNKKTSDR